MKTKAWVRNVVENAVLGLQKKLRMECRQDDFVVGYENVSLPRRGRV